MANKRIQDLEQTTDLTNDDLLPLDTTKKTFATTLKSLTEWLKNTFQTKDNLEQVLSDATDKYPSSKVLKDESSRIVSIMNTGLAKKLSVDDRTVGEITNLITSKLNDNPTTTTYIDGYMINSADDINGCLVAPVLYYNGIIGNRLMARKKINGKNIYQELTIGVKTDGSLFTKLGRGNDDNSIVTTISHGTRYVRFGNGLQICWGAGTGVQVFPQPFRDTNYMIADSDLTHHKYEGMWTTNKTTTQFEVRNSGNAQWIAIGYWY